MWASVDTCCKIGRWSMTATWLAGLCRIPQLSFSVGGEHILMNFSNNSSPERKKAWLSCMIEHFTSNNSDIFVDFLKFSHPLLKVSFWPLFVFCDSITETSEKLWKLCLCLFSFSLNQTGREHWVMNMQKKCKASLQRKRFHMRGLEWLSVCRSTVPIPMR